RVVARALVLLARVAQADDETDQGGLLLLFFLGFFRLFGLLGGLRSSLRSGLLTLRWRLAFLRRSGLLGRRHFGRRHRLCGRFLFLGDQCRHDHGRDDRVLVLVQRQLDALGQRELAHVHRVADREVAEVYLDV